MVVRFYHYTTEESLASIRHTETILPSMAGKFGTGVYFSRLGPRDLPLERLAVNCFGAGGQARLRLGHLNCYIEVFVRNPRFVLKKCWAKGRDVYIYRGSGVMDLRKFAWRADFVTSPRPPHWMRRPSYSFNFSSPAVWGHQNTHFSSPAVCGSQNGHFSSPVVGHNNAHLSSPADGAHQFISNSTPVVGGYENIHFFSPSIGGAYNVAHQNGHFFSPAVGEHQNAHFSASEDRGHQNEHFSPAVGGHLNEHFSPTDGAHQNEHFSSPAVVGHQNEHFSSAVGEHQNEHFSASADRGHQNEHFSPADREHQNDHFSPAVGGHQNEHFSSPLAWGTQRDFFSSSAVGKTQSNNFSSSNVVRNPLWESHGSTVGRGEPLMNCSFSPAVGRPNRNNYLSDYKENLRNIGRGGGKKRKVEADGLAVKKRRVKEYNNGGVKGKKINVAVDDSGYLSDIYSPPILKRPLMEQNCRTSANISPGSAALFPAPNDEIFGEKFWDNFGQR